MSDRPFYDRLLEQHGALLASGYSIRLAEEITVSGQSAGGKSFAYKLYETFYQNDWLVQSNSECVQRVAFFLDRDFEHVTGSARNSAHIIYTSNADAEAEIAAHGQMLRAVSSSYSLTSEQVHAAIPCETMMSELATLWRTWISLLVVAESFGVSVHQLQHAGLSRVNQGNFGQELPAEVGRLKEELKTALGGADAAQRISDKIVEVDAIFEAGEGISLVKGKWIAAFVHHKVRTRLADQFIQSNTNAASIFGAALETVDFAGSWTDYYRQKLELLCNASP